jgi:ATP-dependent Clp protease protease subunit
MIHQPSGGAGGQATDIEIAAKQILLTKKRLNELLAKNSRQPLERIEKDAERDYWMSAGDAKEYGLIDEVIVSKKAPDKKSA